ncbi:MAG: hypothetical protein PHI47_12165 [Sulfuricurvum sp.]|uniref:hypothetical protein n=1 Tax=Sulfuricurvum sp. TaxID=2025608 RepID=UPI0026192E04|nr:hypothetical protein [Sulfuricurvum sp.]MDD5160803.1 hypothetical protein [Sulfuricurvum sp.]
MKCFEIAVFIALFVSSIVNAASEKLPANSEFLTCNKMELHKRVQDYDPPMNTYFVYKNYLIQPDDRTMVDTSYIIKNNNIRLNTLTLKNTGTLIHTEASICNNTKNNEYIIIEDEWEGEDAGSGTGVLVIDISNNTAKKLYRDNFDDERYTPKKLLNQQKYLPITPTLFEKDGGLYMKVGSTYKSDIITLKKSNSGK